MGIGAVEKLMYAYTGANICLWQGTSTTSHIYPSVLQALAGQGRAGCLERQFQGYRAGTMQNPASELPRIPIPRTRVNKGLLDCLLALPGRIGTQPQRDVCGLHTLPYHPTQVLAQGVRFCLVAQLGREGF